MFPINVLLALPWAAQTLFALQFLLLMAPLYVLTGVYLLIRAGVREGVKAAR